MVRTSKSVTQIDEYPDFVRVHTDGDECYEGDLVVGADGVHSRVRAEIWRIANSIEAKQLPDSESRSKSTICHYPMTILETYRQELI